MSPEQARGKAIDKRTDIWAFGCVLYEMLTGKRAFDGEEITDTLAQIIECEPDFTALPAVTPPTIRRLLRRCLDKDRKRRLPDIGVARLEIDEALTVSPATETTVAALTGPTRRERLSWAAATIVAVAGTASGMLYLRPAPVEAPEVRLQINTPPGNPAYFALSPDGRNVVFQATTEGVSRLWLRPLESEDARPPAGTDGATSYTSSETGRNEIYVRPFSEPGPGTRISTNGGTGAQWRGDSREIFYLAPDRRLMAVPLSMRANGRTLETGAPGGLFNIQPNAAYEASPDGQRFLVNAPLGDEATPPITILLNWAGARRTR